jgi:predicted RNA-binding Zn-ribbon protein involved in translation (DUF1610 family)
MIGKLICFFKGHKRGKLVASVFDAKIGKQVTEYSCPRCGRIKTYKAKVMG